MATAMSRSVTVSMGDERIGVLSAILRVTFERREISSVLKSMKPAVGREERGRGEATGGQGGAGAQGVRHRPRRTGHRDHVVVRVRDGAGLAREEVLGAPAIGAVDILAHKRLGRNGARNVVLVRVGVRGGARQARCGHG